MEEKERYVIEFAGQKGMGFLDTKIDRTMSLNDVCNLLNQQDKRIKELEQQLHEEIKEKQPSFTEKC